MAEIALGWLGWTEQQALATDVNAIAIALEGRMQMFETVGWIKRADGGRAEPAAAEITPELFDAMFG